MMMLYFDNGKILLVRPLACQILGMQIARDALGRNFEQALVQRLRRKPRIVGFGVLHIADVLRDERLVLARKAEGIFLLGARREYRSG